MGDLGAEKNHAVHDHIVQKLSVSVSQYLCTFSLPLICPASLYMETHTKISSRPMARSQACETRALHAGGQCELSIIEFIYLAINCSAEVDRYIFIFDKNRVIRDTLTDLCTKIKMLKVTSQLKKIKTKQRLHHPLLVKLDTRIKKLLSSSYHLFILT